MNQLWNKTSFRSKILILLFTVIFLSSGLSLIIVYSISGVSDVNNKVERMRPELVWIHTWQHQTVIKQLALEHSLVNAAYTVPKKVFEDKAATAETTAKYGPIPESLESFENQINQINFIFLNKVAGLLFYENKDMARDVIELELMPALYNLENELNLAFDASYHAIGVQSNVVSDIIRSALWWLFIIFSLAMGFSVYYAYRMSKELTEPVDQLVEDVVKISQGEYGLQVKDHNQVELNELTSSINRMSLSLVESFDKVTKEKMIREQILSSIPISIITVHHQSGEIEVNQKAKQFLQIDYEVLNRILKQPPEAIENKKFWDLFHSRTFFTTRKVEFNSGTNTYHLLVSQSPLQDEASRQVGRIFYFIDISEMEYMEKRIHRSEKLAVLGELAAGAAHEIRNPLAVIDGFIQLLFAGMKVEDRSKYHIDLLIQEIHRINKIIEHMLLLAKPKAPVIGANALDEILNEILPLIYASCPSEIKIRVQLHNNKIHTDLEQFKQVFYNLIRNSIDAIDGTGEIYIYSQMSEQEVRIIIEDTGSGIPVELQEQIFNPFVSNKEKGTGLGLSIIQRIVENHGGELELISSNDKGTKIQISLPLLQDVSLHT